MAAVTVRNLPDEVHRRLRMRAARRGRSMEAEVRAILFEALQNRGPEADPSALQDLVDELYQDQRPEGVVDDLIEERRREAAKEWSS